MGLRKAHLFSFNQILLENNFLKIYNPMLNKRSPAPTIAYKYTFTLVVPYISSTPLIMLPIVTVAIPALYKLFDILVPKFQHS